ncbi:pseudouridine-5'-phosphate glycosidase [Paraburkholderia nemoris]|uniref:pseudouridine-5'-phosphate glycosidase n=1 Tax=Paraburkholderia nemoris TaxID=2793076 RepID=UPI0022798DAB|nr:MULTISPECIES: pseudouridine-5'-phosphate glycosidase [Paraburkholderia]
METGTFLRLERIDCAQRWHGTSQPEIDHPTRSVRECCSLSITSTVCAMHIRRSISSLRCLNDRRHRAAAMSSEEIDTLTQQALAEATAKGIAGKAVPPFLLARIKPLTSGRSLATNIALVKHNAEVGARLALALAPAANDDNRHLRPSR